MKHTIAFILLLGAVLGAGYYSVDFSALIYGSSAESASIARSSAESRAVYINSGENAGFDPMRVLSGENQPNRPKEYDQERQICAGLARCLSLASPETEITADYIESLGYAVYLSTNGYFHIDRFHYRSRSGRLMHLEMIVSQHDFRVIYIRFVPDEAFEEGDPDRALRLAEEFTRDIASPDLVRELEDLNSNLSASLTFEERSSGNSGAEGFSDGFSELSREALEMLGVTSPYSRFWYNALLVSLLHNTGAELDCISYIAETVFGGITPGVPEYTVYKGSLYQYLPISGSTLITLYNIDGGFVEGFFAPPTR